MQAEATNGTGSGSPRPVAPAGASGADLELHFTTDMELTRASLRATKARLREVLVEWQIDDRTANAAYDVAHELLSNALRHGTAPVELAVHATAEQIRVQVSDAARAPARMLPYRPGISEHGLGLRLVQQLSAQWGQKMHDRGKTVWATFHRRPPS